MDHIKHTPLEKDWFRPLKRVFSGSSHHHFHLHSTSFLSCRKLPAAPPCHPSKAVIPSTHPCRSHHFPFLPSVHITVHLLHLILLYPSLAVAPLHPSAIHAFPSIHPHKHPSSHPSHPPLRWRSGQSKAGMGVVFATPSAIRQPSFLMRERDSFETALSAYGKRQGGRC